MNDGFRLGAVAHQELLLGGSVLANESKRLRIALPSGSNACVQIMVVATSESLRQACVMDELRAASAQPHRSSGRLRRPLSAKVERPLTGDEFCKAEDRTRCKAVVLSGRQERQADAVAAPVGIKRISAAPPQRLKSYSMVSGA